MVSPTGYDELSDRRAFSGRACLAFRHCAPDLVAAAEDIAGKPGHSTERWIARALHISE